MTAAAIGKVTSRMNRINAGEWLVWVTVLLMLGAGLFLRGRIEGRTARFSQGSVTLEYPADWTALADEEDYQIFHVVDPASSIQFPTSIRVRQIPLGELGRAAGSLGDVALSWSTRQGEQISVYSVLQILQTSVRGQPAIAVDYAYVAEPALGTAAGSIPSVALAQDVLLQRGDMITVVTFEASTDTYQQELEQWVKILASLDVK
jgi:hypothetical protein